MYTPPLSQSDFVGFEASPDVYQYVLAFSTPIRDPVMHLSSLASALILSTSNITKLSGDPLFEVAGNVVSGVINDNPIGYDTNGTIIFSGVFDTISFSANYLNPPLEPTDGIIMQIGGAPVPIPAAVWLFGSALAGMFGFARRKR